MHKTTGEGWNTYSLFILVLSTELCVLKTPDEVWDPYRLEILVQNALLCICNSMGCCAIHPKIAQKPMLSQINHHNTFDLQHKGNADLKT